jgi:hypothetical protein
MMQMTVQTGTAERVLVIVAPRDGSGEVRQTVEPGETAALAVPSSANVFFSPHPLQRPASPKPGLTRWEFQLLWTADEHRQIKLLRTTDPEVDYLMDLFEGAGTIHLDNPVTVSGVAYMLAIGIITVERRDQILAGIRQALPGEA